MKHFMVDMETLGLGNIPVITSIGFAEFDITTGETTRYVEYCVDARSCVEAGGKVDGSTLEWWLKQDPNVFSENVLMSLRSGLIEDEKEMSIKDVILEFSDFVKKNLAPKEDFRIWSNGLLADAKWIESYVDALGLKDKVCWKYWQFNDVRTLVDLGWQILGHDYKKTCSFVGNKHDPIADCKFQAKYVSDIYGRFIHLKKSQEDTASAVKDLKCVK